MAATRLIPMHLQKSRSMGQCLKERTDYAKMMIKQKPGNMYHLMNVILTLWSWNLKSQRISMRLTPEEVQEKRT